MCQPGTACPTSPSRQSHVGDASLTCDSKNLISSPDHLAVRLTSPSRPSTMETERPKADKIGTPSPSHRSPPLTRHRLPPLLPDVRDAPLAAARRRDDRDLRAVRARGARELYVCACPTAVPSSLLVCIAQHTKTSRSRRGRTQTRSRAHCGRNARRRRSSTRRATRGLWCVCPGCTSHTNTNLHRFLKNARRAGTCKRIPRKCRCVGAQAR